ncbi:MAG: Inositol-pentakisphosphate 2-kinase [Stictis urceolatum]|nr:Inositol-pentakisphosphate 2-kinase [Stictis urceolata]
MATARLPDSLELTYLAEGAANIVYRLRSPIEGTFANSLSLSGSVTESFGKTTPPPTEIEALEAIGAQQLDDSFMQGKLLRLRKDVPSATSIIEAQVGYEDLIAPLFDPNHLVQQTVVEISNRTLGDLDLQLKEMDAKEQRPARRRGQYLRKEGFAVLVTDMSVREGKDVVTVEVKPKWLLQSPSAPRDAKRCRTCALSAMRNSKNEHPSIICPLYLVSKDKKDVEKTMRRLIQRRDGIPNDLSNLSGSLADFIMHSSLLSTLKDLQASKDPVGTIASDTHGEDFRVAMTLRDCTLFLRVPLNPNEPIEARIGDLDLKSPEKSESWKFKERALIEEGWYTESESLPPSSEGLCALRE